MISDIIAKAQEYQEQLPLIPPIKFLTKPLSAYLDCALHAPDSTPDMVHNLCAEARQNQYASVFINPIYVPLASKSLEGSGVHVGTVIGFPLGEFPTEIKIAEAKRYLEMGANELDMVIPVGLLKTGDYQYLFDEISQLADIVHTKGGLLKVILEMVLLNQFEKIIGCLLSKAANADFVKTSTGFSKGGATVEDINLMRRVVGPSDVMGVKAAGGIHTFDDALKMINAGADRLGTRLAVDILAEYRRKNPDLQK